MSKAFSLFVSHNEPVEIVKTTAVKEEKKDEEVLISIKELKRKQIDEFKIRTCSLCGGDRFDRYGLIAVCKRCGSEFNPNGIMFGDKLKNKR